MVLHSEAFASSRASASAMDFEQARFNMIEQQVRPWEVLDQAVLDGLSAVPREDFVPPHLRALAFVDMELPLGHGEVMLAPKLEARLVQEAELKAADRVLEVGTGSGYMTALLARLASHVCSVEIVAELSGEARRRLDRRGVANATLEIGDAARGWSAHAPYDAIVVTGSLPVLPESLEQMLAPGGRLVAIVGDAPAMTACRVTRASERAFTRVNLFETCVKALRNAPQPERFVF